ncbi:MAG: iron-siderophore ABC transporter substrate-binding protein [Cyanobacteria bacterium P01_H01_bin.21]
MSDFLVHVSASVSQKLNRRFFLLMGASTLIASACTRATKLDNQAANVTNTTVKHAFGETEIPTNPTRIIVWGYVTIEAVVAHGVQPIGVPNGVFDYMRHLSLDREIISEIGDPGQPNLEKMAALTPDLILSSKYRVRENYPLLSQIAPTVVLNINSNHEWKELTRLCGEALGKQAETEKLVAAYESKLQQVRAQLSQKSKQSRVSIVSFSPGRIGAYGIDTFAGTVLADVGILRPASQAQAQGPQNISLESLDLLDGDVIFIVTLQRKTEWGTEMRTEIDRMQAQPLWSQLKAVKTKQVYEVNSHWMIGSYLSADLILDDLLTYLVEHQ